MNKKLKFKVGDKVKVIATEEQLFNICISLYNCNEDFYYIKAINFSGISFLPYKLSNNYNMPEEYLDYAD